MALGFSSVVLPIHQSVVSPSTRHGHGRIKNPRRDLVVLCADQTKKESIRSRPSSSDKGGSSNLVLRAAWYGAEALGNIVAVFNPKADSVAFNDSTDAVFQGPLSREYVVQAIVEDYDKAYFINGNVSTGVYEEDCEFADPAGSFKSLKRFTNNCSNFGKLLEKSDVKLMKSKELPDKFVAYWRFSCVLKFPWKPILSSTGFTEYYFDQTSGRICRHVENWNVPKMALLGQVFKPNPAMSKKQN